MNFALISLVDGEWTMLGKHGVCVDAFNGVYWFDTLAEATKMADEYNESNEDDSTRVLNRAQVCKLFNIKV